jgi:hypothetical protein
VIAQIPTLPEGSLENWLFCALVVSNMAIAVKALGRRQPLEREFVLREEFREFRESVEKELGRLRTQSERQYLDLAAKTDAVTAHVARIEAAIERLDERTK